jgi:hypothetical protein
MSKKVKVKILVPVAGKFLLSSTVGDVVLYPAGLAAELIESKYAEAFKASVGKNQD